PDGTESPEAKRLITTAEAMGYPIVFISAAARDNLKELTDEISRSLAELPPVTTFEAEITPMDLDADKGASDAVTIRRGDDGAFICEGIWLEELVRRVNFDERESLMYFQRMLIQGGIIERLREHGCEEGDTVRMCGIEFDFVE
ncbi:MAG: DUF1967 domain-containing protein, partial [Ruminococcaceae bacterium]|nr:DUF1967 domain-containing protein [Oscillospiraceae bacterium]